MINNNILNIAHEFDFVKMCEINKKGVKALICDVPTQLCKIIILTVFKNIEDFFKLVKKHQ